MESYAELLKADNMSGKAQRTDLTLCVLISRKSGKQQHCQDSQTTPIRSILHGRCSFFFILLIHTVLCARSGSGSLATVNSTQGLAVRHTATLTKFPEDPPSHHHSPSPLHTARHCNCNTPHSGAPSPSLSSYPPSFLPVHCRLHRHTAAHCNTPTHPPSPSLSSCPPPTPPASSSEPCTGVYVLTVRKRARREGLPAAGGWGAGCASVEGC